MGIKNKVLAAQRSGIKKVLLPIGNKKDLPDIPDAVRDSLKIVFVERMEDVLRHALERGENVSHSQAILSLFQSYPQA